MQLVPSADLKQLSIRISRFSSEKTFAIEKLLPSLCEYTFNDVCPDQITGIRKTFLDGDTIWEDTFEDKNEIELFTIDTYEVMLDL